MRKNKQRWEYEEESYYGARASHDVDKRKVRRENRRSAALNVPDEPNFDALNEEE